MHYPFGCPVLQFLDGTHDTQPNCSAGQIALVQQLIRTHGGVDSGVVAVLLDAELHRTVYVDVGGHIESQILTTRAQCRLQARIKTKDRIELLVSLEEYPITD